MLLPVIIVLSVIGVFSVNNSMFDLWVMFVFGVLGYFFKKFELPRGAPGAGPGAGGLPGALLRQSLAMSQNDPTIFFTRPISGVMMFIAIASLVAPVVQSFMDSRREARFDAGA